VVDLDAVYQRSESLVTRDLAGERIIVPVRRNVGDLNSIYTLNPMANQIWSMLDGERTVADIVRVLGQEYDSHAATLAKDVCQVLEDLAGEGLVRPKTS